MRIVTVELHGTSSDNVITLSQTIVVEFPVDERKISESKGKDIKLAQANDWMECRSDESNNSDNEYKYEEDSENMVVKKYKKKKNELGGPGKGSIGSNIQAISLKEPFYYTEEVRLETLYDQENRIKVYKL